MTVCDFGVIGFIRLAPKTCTHHLIITYSPGLPGLPGLSGLSGLVCGWVSREGLSRILGIFFSSQGYLGHRQLLNLS